MQVIGEAWIIYEHKVEGICEHKWFVKFEGFINANDMWCWTICECEWFVKLEQLVNVNDLWSLNDIWMQVICNAWMIYKCKWFVRFEQCERLEWVMCILSLMSDEWQIMCNMNSMSDLCILWVIQLHSTLCLFLQNVSSSLNLSKFII